MPTTHLEVERKYAVGPDAPPPDLAGHGWRLVAAAPAHLEAVYLDTAGRTLLGARIALRRRTGGTDAGWHLKLPGDAGRFEVHEPIDPAAPEALPASLAALLRSRLRGHALEPIAIVRTTRVATTATGEAGHAVEVVDDLVTASDVRAGTVRSWREWEAEAVGGDQAGSVALLDRVGAVLLAAGARPSASPAKLAQALGLGAWTAPPRGTRAGDALDAAVARLTERLHRGEAELAGGGGDEAVHELRKTVRRLRAVLSVREVAGAEAGELRAGLKAVGRLLGEGRDRDVAAATAAGLLDRVDPAAPGIPDARRGLVDGPRRDAAALRTTALAAFGSPGHFALLQRLERFASDGAAAGGPQRAVLRAAMRRAARRARRRAVHAGVDLDSLHEARRAARRFELLVAALAEEGVRAGARTRRSARAAEAVHDALGAHRDLALLAAALPEAARTIARGGGDAFAVGVVAERARRRVRRAERAGRRALRALTRR